MTDQELAEKVLALGIGYPNHNGCFTMNPSNDEGDEAKYFVRDWLVAGALMEKVGEIEIFHAGDEYVADVPTPGSNLRSAATNNSLPRAIIEACVEALA